MGNNTKILLPSPFIIVGTLEKSLGTEAAERAGQKRRKSARAVGVG